MDSLGIRVPDGIEPFTACRIWTIDPAGPTLRSLVQGTLWTPRHRLQARCLSEDERSHQRPPQADCSCGVWGLANPSDLASYAAQPTVVAGTVRLWGRVVACEFGWRGEFGLPEALVIAPAREAMREAWWRQRYPDFPPRDEVVQAAAARYGLEVLTSWPALSEPAQPAVA